MCTVLDVMFSSAPSFFFLLLTESVESFTIPLEHTNPLFSLGKKSK